MTDTTEVYAVPGKGSIIDTINPATGLTSCFAESAAEVLERNPDAVRMTWIDWSNAAIKLQQTPLRWRSVSEAQYHEMLEVLPPASWKRGAFLVGEPWDHCIATGAPRFAVYVAHGGKHYTADRPITKAEFSAMLAQENASEAQRATL
jgi:hypothetical protein